jgi:hypothetical protein
VVDAAELRFALDMERETARWVVTLGRLRQ